MEQVIPQIIIETHWSTIAANIAVIAAAVIGLGTLIYIARQVKASYDAVSQSRHNTQIVNTITLIRALFDPSYIENMTNAMRFLGDESKSIEEKKEILRKVDTNTDAKELSINIKHTLNLFELVAVMYNQNLLDKSLVKRFMKTASLEYHNRSRWFIEKARTKYKSPSIYCEWEKMNKDFEET